MLRGTYIFKQHSDTSCQLLLTTFECIICGFKYDNQILAYFFLGQECGNHNHRNILEHSIDRLYSKVYSAN